MTKPALAAAMALALGSCAMGVYGMKGNDTGGIIAWSPANEAAALQIAQDNCGTYGKYAQITSVRRMYGDYIAYICTFDPARRIYRRQEIVHARG